MSEATEVLGLIKAYYDLEIAEAKMQAEKMRELDAAFDRSKAETVTFVFKKDSSQ